MRVCVVSASIRRSNLPKIIRTAYKTVLNAVLLSCALLEQRLAHYNVAPPPCSGFRRVPFGENALVTQSLDVLCQARPKREALARLAARVRRKNLNRFCVSHGSKTQLKAYSPILPRVPQAFQSKNTRCPPLLLSARADHACAC